MKRRDVLLGLGAGAKALAQDLDLSAEIHELFGSRSGTAVLLDAARGNVIAPHRLDRGATRLASPGGVIMPFSLLTLIESGALPRIGALRCAGGVTTPDGSLRCTHPRFAGVFDPVQALAWSCGSWFWQAGARLDTARLMSVLKRYGFGGMSGVAPLENPAELTEPRSLEELRRLAAGLSSVRVNAVGVAVDYRRLAMLRLKNEPAHSPLWKGLEEAARTGSAQRAAVAGLSVAGISGTAVDIGDGSTHAWFAGWTPAGAARVVLIVFLERGRGESEAAPLASEILAAWNKRIGSRPR